MTEDSNRRPLASRNSGWAKGIARWLVSTSITPNQISQTSMVMAALSAAAFWFSADATGVARVAFLLVAGLFCQLRLLCNLFDGMVAVEGGKVSPTGAFWNEFPDRIADILILAGMGYAAGAPVLGWAAAALAVLTAYTRELGHAGGAAVDFCGPMAKPHRMAAVTIAVIIAVFEPLWNGTNQVLNVGLWLIMAGTVITIIRRVKHVLDDLNRRRSTPD